MIVELTSTAELLVFWAIAGYFLGAIPFGIVTARALRSWRFTTNWVGQYRGHECAAHRLETRCSFYLDR